MTYKEFEIEWVGGVTLVKDIELSEWLVENAVNDYDILSVKTKQAEQY